MPHIQVDSANIKNAVIETAHIKAGNITTPYIATYADIQDIAAGFYFLDKCRILVNAVANTPIMSIFGFSYEPLSATNSDPDSVGASIRYVYVSFGWWKNSSVQGESEPLYYLDGVKNGHYQIISSYITTPTISGGIYIGPKLGQLDWGWTGNLRLTNQFHVALALYR